MSSAAPLELEEWSPWVDVPVALSPEAQRVCAALDAARRLRVQRTLDGRLQLRTTQWVGAVQLDELHVSISPKFSNLTAGLTRLLQRTFGLEQVSWIDAQRRLAAEARAPLADIVVLLLLAGVERLLRVGLLSDYVERDEPLPVIRGRINVRQQLTRRPGRVSPIECRFEDRTAAIPENLVLAHALESAARSSALAATRQHARRLSVELAGDLDLDRQFSLADLRRLTRPDRIARDRQRARYAGLLELAWLVIDHAGVRDMTADGTFSSDAFLVDMNMLFERFFARWLAVQLADAGIRVDAQHSAAAFIDRSTGAAVNRMRPDLVLTSRDGRRCAIDTKYKRMDARSGRLVASASDLQQAGLYATWIGGERPVAAIVAPLAEGSPFQPRILDLRSGSFAERVPSVHLLGLALDEVLAEPETAPPARALELVDAVAALVGASTQRGTTTEMAAASAR